MHGLFALEIVAFVVGSKCEMCSCVGPARWGRTSAVVALRDTRMAGKGGWKRRSTITDEIRIVPDDGRAVFSSYDKLIYGAHVALSNHTFPTPHCSYTSTQNRRRRNLQKKYQCHTVAKVEQSVNISYHQQPPFSFCSSRDGEGHCSVPPSAHLLAAASISSASTVCMPLREQRFVSPTLCIGTVQTSTCNLSTLL